MEQYAKVINNQDLGVSLLVPSSKLAVHLSADLSWR